MEAEAIELSAVVLVEELIVKTPKRVAPTLPTKTILPVPAVKDKSSVPALVPVRVLKNVMSPIPAPVLSAKSPVKVTAEVKEILSLVVVMSPAVDTRPAPS